MKKRTEKLTGILLLGLLALGIQSCTTANDVIDPTKPATGVQDEYRRTATAPTVSTVALTLVTSTTAVSGGNITNTGSSHATITASGVCWGTTANPTTANHVVASGTATSFSVKLSGLPATYYVRAYATNSYGLTGYGNQITGTGTVTTPPTGTGNTGSYTPSSPISLSGQSGQTISGKFIGNISGVAINLSNCHDMIITGMKISHTVGSGIVLTNCYNITITHCEIDSVKSGLYAQNCTGGIVFNYNDAKNMQGPFPQAQMAQFDHCSGAGNSVSYNTCDNVPGYSHPEDIINMWMSTGTASSPIQINGNKIRGGGPSTSGGGIIMGDGGGGYQVAKNNILVDPGQYGMSIAGGSNNIIDGNVIYGKSQAFTNVGLYLWNQYAAACANNTVQNNRVNFRYKAGQLNDFYNGSAVKSGTSPLATGTVWTNNVDDQTLTASLLPAVLFGTNK